MILIADSGASKTHWRLIDGDHIQQLETLGLHPRFNSEKKIDNQLHEVCKTFNSPIHELYFYGAGCAENSNKKQLLENQLNKHFSKAKVYIYSDLLAAAHACLAKKSGLIGILGTGANTAYYDGEALHQKVPSLGYVLGDEGSGAYLGKLLLSSLLRGDLPEKLSKKLCLKKEDVLEKIHSSAQPNKYLASFGPFLFRNRMDPQISMLLKHAFGTFVDHYVSPYGEAQHISMVGSIAYYFRTELQYVLNERGHYLGTVIEHPISALSLYYLED